VFDVPLTSIFIGLLFILGVARLAMRLSPRQLGKFGLWLMAASFVYLIVIFFGGWLTDLISPNYGFIGGFFLYLALMLLLFHAVRTEAPLDENTRFQRFSGIWLLILFITLATFNIEYEQNLSLLDFTNKLWRSWFGEPQKPVVESLLSAYGTINIKIVLHIVKFFVLGTLVASYFGYLLFASYFGRPYDLDWREIKAPRWLPWILLADYLLVWANDLFALRWYVFYWFGLLLPIIVSVYLFLGIIFVLRRLEKKGWMRWFVSVVLAVTFITKTTTLLLIAVGLLNNLFGIELKPAPVYRHASPVLRGTMNNLLSRKGIAVLVVLFIVLAVVGSNEQIRGLFDIDKKRSMQPHIVAHVEAPIDGEHLPPDMRLIEKNGRRFLMDLYEYPNRAGALPRSGVDYREAEQICALEGKRLCTDQEWMTACHWPDERTFEFADEPVTARKILVERCNVRPLFSLPAGVVPSGSLSCENDLHLHDMTGNLWEWVSNPSSRVFRQLKGGSYNYNDSQSTSCAYSLLVLDSQIKQLNLSSVGFRCCADPR